MTFGSLRPIETPETPPPERVPWYRRIPAWALFGTGAVIVAALVPLSIVLTTNAQQAQTNADSANGRAESVQQVAAPLAGGVQLACSGTDQAAAQLKAKGLCSAASAVQSAVSGPPGPSGPAGPGPSQEAINAAVAGYLAAHPPAAGQDATPAQVAAAVAAYLTANPPQPGRPPTAEEIANAANAYLAAHPDSFRGEAGKSATADQVAQAVQTYCSEHGNCAGSPGAAGAKGDTGATGPQGPAGPAGPPGPVCDETHHPAEVTAGLPPVTFLACVDN
jgi:hypothetical protein